MKMKFMCFSTVVFVLSLVFNVNIAQGVNCTDYEGTCYAYCISAGYSIQQLTPDTYGACPSPLWSKTLITVEGNCGHRYGWKWSDMWCTNWVGPVGTRTSSSCDPV
jgi:hypothetical protein